MITQNFIAQLVHKHVHVQYMYTDCTDYDDVYVHVHLAPADVTDVGD